ncbi:MAG: hypothetical protein M3279_07810 [Actinomycetota bacterium]|nr:hypothetical protein [Actinomycetota bacterium]
MYVIENEPGLAVAEVVAFSLLGVLLAETLEALRVFVSGGPDGPAYHWPRKPPFLRYATASALRVVLAIVVALSLSALGIACNEAIAFLSVLSTIKMVEIVLGYTGRGL